MTALTADDPDFFPRLDAALARVAFADVHGLERELDLYRAVTAVLIADGSTSLPLGAFGRYLRARGHFKRKAAGRRFVAGLVLLDPPDGP
ncbi:hypothetical protein [Streptomyces sp. NPDC059850]|uniref:hypothetical protein n=1 Tax=Streptomyces sp. NPDC059850 TaxID=3346970 RepID=UPI00365E258E